MDDLTAFERLVAGRVQHYAGPIRPVNDAAIFSGIVTAQSARWRYRSMFGAMKFVVAGVIVALFGGIIMTGVLTTKPEEETVPAVEASALASPSSAPQPSATPERPAPASPAPAQVAPSPTTRPELLPGVDVVSEEVAPGIYRLLRDGVHDLTSGVRSVMIGPDGGVWVLRGDVDDWYVERLGDPGSSRTLERGEARRLWDFDGTRILGSPTTPAEFTDGTWVEDDSPEALCEAFIRRVGVGHSVRMGDGTCWYAGGKPRDLSQVGVEDSSLEPKDLGLSRHHTFERLSAGPDGTGWSTVRALPPDKSSASFAGLLRYHDGTWTHVPYRASTNSAPARVGGTIDLAVAPDGTVWILEAGPTGSVVMSWDGEAWDRYGPFNLSGSGSFVQFSPRPLTYFRPDGGIAFLQNGLLFDGKALHLLELPEGWILVPPDGFGWTAHGDPVKGLRRPRNQGLYVIDPNALIGAE
jgi:hypothetical protein